MSGDVGWWIGSRSATTRGSDSSGRSGARSIMFSGMSDEKTVRSRSDGDGTPS